MPYIIRKEAAAIRQDIDVILAEFSARELVPLQRAIDECWSRLKDDPTQGYLPSANDPNWWHIKDSRRLIKLTYNVDVPAPGQVLVTGLIAIGRPTP